MALTPISNSVEFVQDSVPTTAADGDSWLDTSLSPPRLKVFDDAVGGFIEPRSIQNLDAKVSNSGQGVEWDNKIPEVDITSSSSFTVTGSGYLVSLKPDGSQSFNLTLTIDGSQIATNINNDGGDQITFGFFRFNSSFELSNLGSNIIVSYVLD
jgi:hypothetical protein